MNRKQRRREKQKGRDYLKNREIIAIKSLALIKDFCDEVEKNIITKLNNSYKSLSNSLVSLKRTKKITECTNNIIKIFANGYENSTKILN